jgi:hypothetical protein
MNKRLSLYIFIGLVLSYAAIVMFSAPDPTVLHKYHLTAMSVRLLNLTVVLPVTAIWAAAYYGFYRLNQYALSVKSSAEDTGWKTLARGLYVLAMSLPLTSCVSAILNNLSRSHPDLLPRTTIIRNYITVITAVVAFYFIARGAEALTTLVRRKRTMVFDIQSWTIGFIILSSMFTWFVASHHPVGSGPDTVYYMPDWLVVTTLIIPYLYVWYRGSMAAYCLYFFQTNVKGSLYKKALQQISGGIAVVILTSIAIQVLTVFSARLNRLDLKPILVILYLLIVVYAIGYILIARGAKKLKTFEEV